VVDWSLATARSVSAGVVLVVPADVCDRHEPLADVVVAGDETRSGSVRKGLAALPDDATLVLVHDAARPVPVVDVWQRVVDALGAGAEAVVPAVPVTDTVRDLEGGTVDRTRLVTVQTPQGFRVDLLRRAHANGDDATDDAALVAHACADALLGAAGLGDLGGHFPDTDPAWAGADSLGLLGEVARRIADAGWDAVNVDCTVILERPKIAPHRDAMERALGAAVGAPVSVKATRPEGLGALGGGEGIACIAVALVEERRA
jgi:2-C-methyl-D-erythritol 2,4-cyclodiphosphate synthase